MPTPKRPAKTPRAAPRAARTRARETPKTHSPRKASTEREAAKAATKRDAAHARDSAQTFNAERIATRKNAARPADEARRTTVAVVGAGRLGSALALALDARGYEIAALVSRQPARARRAARRLARSRPLALSALQLDRLPDTDLLVIATPDDQIEATAAALAASLDESADPSPAPPSSPSSHTPPRPRRARRVALHASGALSSEQLAPLRARGFAVGSLHPLVSVSDAETAPDNLRGAFYCVEGDPAAVRLARRVVRTLGGRSFSVGARDKALYHAAAVLAAGHAVALFDLATQALAACGLTRARARAVLLPLARSAVANLAASRTNAAALTGPFARADNKTVRRNLSAFAARGLDLPRAAYALLGLASLDLAAQAEADPASLDAVARALAEAEREKKFETKARRRS